jgi:hypothetical protein
MSEIKINQDGSTLVVTVLVLVILSILGTAALTLTNTELLIARNMKLKANAFYNAESGVRFALTGIKRGLINSTLDLPGIKIDKDELNGLDLSATLNVDNARSEGIIFLYPNPLSENPADSNRYCFISTGKDETDSDTKATISTCFQIKDKPYYAFKQGIVSGGNININGVVNIDGNLHANGNITQTGVGGGAVDGQVTSVYESEIDADVNGTIAFGEEYEIHIPRVTSDNIPSEFDADEVLSGGEEIDQSLVDNVWNDTSSENPIIYVNGDVTIKSGTDVASLTIISEGSIEFKGHSSWEDNEKLSTTIIAMNDITFNGSSDSYGIFWCNGSFIRKGSSLVHGSIVAGAEVDDSDVDFSGTLEFNYVDNMSDDIYVPSPSTPVNITWKEM